jgi:tellurite resistance protein TerC
MTVDLRLWLAFAVFVVFLLALDLFVFHRTPHRVSLREAAAYSLLWVALGLGFAGALWVWQGPAPAGEYLAGYLVEKSLSLDNIFVFALVFSYFAVPSRLQYRVLFWGVVGAILLRAAFIAAGAALLASFHVVVYLFGAFLVLTGARIARHETVEIHPERNPLLRLLRRFLPLTDGYRGERLFVRERRRRVATPLVAALVVVAAFDVVFAVDSIPAVFAITREPFLVFAANAFSLLGLRALYFLLAGSMRRFRHLNVGLGAILAFVGARMLASDLYHVPVWASLAFIVVTLALTVLASLRRPPAAPPAPGRDAMTPPAERQLSAPLTVSASARRRR